MKTLYEIAKENSRLKNILSKHDSYYEVYEKLFESKRNDKLNIFEIGVDYGESSKMFSQYFKNSNLIGIDINLREIDFQDFLNFEYIKCDQTDETGLKKIISEKFNDQIDIVIEDASHVGALSKRSFEIVFPYVKSGGFYIIEDWGTGYWNGFIDGQEYFDPILMGKRIHSHDFGMVGFVKSLIDEVGALDIKSTESSNSNKNQRVKSITYYFGLVVLEKY
jgi:hypothetical protein